MLHYISFYHLTDKRKTEEVIKSFVDNKLRPRLADEVASKIGQALKNCGTTDSSDLRDFLSDCNTEEKLLRIPAAINRILFNDMECCQVLELINNFFYG